MDCADRAQVLAVLARGAIADIATVFLPMAAAWQRMAGRYSDAELELIVQFYGQMEEVIRQHIAVLRATGDAR
jgi:hypothetical protein